MLKFCDDHNVILCLAHYFVVVTQASDCYSVLKPADLKKAFEMFPLHMLSEGGGSKEIGTLLYNCLPDGVGSYDNINVIWRKYWLENNVLELFSIQVRKNEFRMTYRLYSGGNVFVLNLRRNS